MRTTLFTLVCLASSVAVAQLSPNLVRNPGGEQFRNLVLDPGQPTKPGSGYADFDFWTADPSVPQAGINDYIDWPVNAGPPVEERGEKYFIGGPLTTNGFDWGLNQVQTLPIEAAIVDTGAVVFRLSAWLGGFGSQNDRASYSVTFLAADGTTVLGTTTVGPVTNTDRNNRPGTELLLRETAELIPVGSRFVRYRIDFLWTQGFHNGCADNVGFQTNILTLRVAPDTFTVRLGRRDQGNAWSLAERDGDALRICKFVVPNQVIPPVNVEFDGWTGVSAPTGFRFRSVAKTTVAGAFQGIVDLWDWSLSTWSTVDTVTDTLNLGYKTLEVTATGDLARYVQAGTGAVRARFRGRSTGVVASPSWCIDLDQAAWYVTW